MASRLRSAQRPAAFAACAAFDGGGRPAVTGPPDRRIVGRKAAGQRGVRAPRASIEAPGAGGRPRRARGSRLCAAAGRVRARLRAIRRARRERQSAARTGSHAAARGSGPGTRAIRSATSPAEGGLAQWRRALEERCLQARVLRIEADLAAGAAVSSWPSSSSSWRPTPLRSARGVSSCWLCTDRAARPRRSTRSRERGESMPQNSGWSPASSWSGCSPDAPARRIAAGPARRA